MAVAAVAVDVGEAAEAAKAFPRTKQVISKACQK